MPQTNWLFIANDGNEKFQRGTLYWDNYPQNALRDFTLNVYGNIDDIDGEVHYFNSFPFGISINEKFTNQILAICLISLTSIVSVSVLIVIGVQTRHYIHRRINKKLVKKV
jgi:hypothetical protein